MAITILKMRKYSDLDAVEYKHKRHTLAASRKRKVSKFNKMKHNAELI